MKTINTIILILSAFTALSMIEYLSIKKQFIDEIKHHALRIEKRYDIPFEVTIAVAALESGWGKNETARRKRNLLGIELSETKQLLEFATYHDSFEYFGKLLSGSLSNEWLRKKYKPLKFCKNFRTYCITLQSVGYCPKDGYGSKLIEIIIDNNLYIKDGLTKSN